MDGFSFELEEKFKKLAIELSHMFQETNLVVDAVTMETITQKKEDEADWDEEGNEDDWNEEGNEDDWDDEDESDSDRSDEDILLSCIEPEAKDDLISYLFDFPLRELRNRVDALGGSTEGKDRMELCHEIKKLYTEMPAYPFYFCEVVSQQDYTEKNFHLMDLLFSEGEILHFKFDNPDIPYHFLARLDCFMTVSVFEEPEGFGVKALKEMREQYEQFLVIKMLEKQIDDYARAAVNIYGIISMFDFCEMVKRYDGSESLSETLIRYLLDFIISKYSEEDEDEEEEEGEKVPNHFFIDENDYLCHEFIYINAPNSVTFKKEIFERKQNFTVWDKEDFIKYADELYTKNPDLFEKCLSVMRDHIPSSDEDELDALLLTIITTSRINRARDVWQIICRDYGIHLDQDEQEIINQVFSHLAFNEPHWVLNGDIQGEQQ